jgi:hypothetical protein
MLHIRLPILLTGVALGAHAFADAPPTITTEPLVLPEQHAAMQHAQQTLRAANALVGRELDGERLGGVGLQLPRFAVGEVSIRNPVAVYKGPADGDRTHIGYAFQMKTGSASNAPWVNVVTNRRGRIANRLFSGGDSVFAQANPQLPAGTLDRVARTDLAGPSLDVVSKWTARRQQRLGSTKPFVLKSVKPTG